MSASLTANHAAAAHDADQDFECGGLFRGLPVAMLLSAGLWAGIGWLGWSLI